MKPTSKLHRGYRGFVAATLGLTASLTLPVVFSGNVLLAQAPPPSHVSAIDPFVPHTAPQAASPQTRQQAFHMLHLARKAVAHKDIATAERLLNEVIAMRLTYQEKEDQPARVQNLIQDYHQLAELGRTQTPGNAEQFRREYARFHLIQADTMILRGELDLATQLTQEATKQQVQYTQKNREEGLEPSVMFKRIEDARRARNLTAPAVAVQAPQQPLSQKAQEELKQAFQKLQQAREALESGQLDQAEQHARAAAAYELPEFAFQGNTPNRMLSEIAARRQGMAVNPQPASANPPIAANAQTAVYHPGQDQQPVLQTASSSPTLAPQVPVPVPGRNTVPYVDQVTRNQQAAMSQISSHIIQQLMESQKMSREQHKPDEALNMLYNLKRYVEQLTQLDAEAKASYIQQVNRAIEEEISYRNRFSGRERQNQENEAVLAELRYEAEKFRYKEEQLKAMFKEYNKLIDDGRFAEAVIIAKKIKEFAPDDPAAQAMVTMSQFVYNINRSQEIRDLKAEGFNEALIAVDRSAIVPDFSKSPLHYAANWRELSQKRQWSNQNRDHQVSEKEQQIKRQLEMPVALNVNTPLTLEQAVKMLCSAVDIPVWFDEAGLKEAGVLTGTLVTMPPTNGIKMKNALSLILDQQGEITYVVKKELLNITSKHRAKGEMNVRFYYIGDLIRETSPNVGVNPVESLYKQSLREIILNKSGSSVNPNVNMQNSVPGGIPLSQNRMPNGQTEGDPNILSQYGGGMSGGYGGMSGGYGGMSGGYGGMSGGYGGMSGGYGGGGMMGMGFNTIDQIIMSVVQPESWDDGATLTMHPSTMSLAIRQTEDAHAEIEDLLAQIRRMNDLQVAVEIRYIILTDNFFERMGTGFDMVFRNDKAFSRISHIQNTFLDGSGNEVTTATARGNNTVVGMSQQGVWTSDASIPLMQDSFGLAVPAFGGYNPAAGISTGVALLSDLEAYFFIQAAQGDQRNSVMEAPKVMLQNNMPGSIIDETVIPFVTNVVPFVADFATAYQPVVTMLPTGQRLIIHASVQNDRRHVLLTLNPTFTTITNINSFTFMGTGPGTEETITSSTSRSNVGDDTSGTPTVPLTDARSNTRTTTSSDRHSGITLQQPQVSTFSVSTTVNCPDGGTVMLGGIKRMSEGRMEAGTPILNKIPYLSRLFANVAIGRDTQSIMIMVTPRIIIQEEEESFIMGTSAP